MDGTDRERRETDIRMDRYTCKSAPSTKPPTTCTWEIKKTMIVLLEHLDTGVQDASMAMEMPSKEPNS